MTGTLFVCASSPTSTMSSSSPASTPSDLLVTMYRLDRIQNLASLIAVLVSMTALLVCLVVYLLFPALRRPTSGRCLICLIVCLFVGQLLYLAAALHGFDAFEMVGDSTSQAEMCYWLAVATHYILLAGAFWLNVIAMDAARSASIDPQVRTSCRVFIQDFISGEYKQEPGVAHGYTRDLLTYLLECCCVLYIYPLQI